MEKVYFRDNEKMTILNTLIVMTNLLFNFKDSSKILDKEKMDEMRKIFVERYTSLEVVTEPILTLSVAEKSREVGVEFNIEELKKTCLMNGILELKFRESMTQEQLRLEKQFKQGIRKTFVFDNLYDYFENQLKKVIVSEMFKRMFKITPKLDFTVMVTSEKLDKIFEGDKIKNRESFFIQQLQTWMTYNEIIPFVKCEINEREAESEVCKKDIYIRVNLIKYLLENKVR